MNETYASVGYCPVCGQGRQFVMRDEQTGQLFVCCEDCEAEWSTPEAAKSSSLAARNQHTHASFVTMDELTGHEWEPSIINR